MSIQYFGDHSVTFIKKSGDLISYRRSWVDWHLVPASRPFVSPAAPNVQIVSIPGSNKTIDLTESLSGSVTFARRSGTWSFIVDHDKWSNWHTPYKEIMSFINGQELYCVLEDDHDTVYHGRLALNEWQNGDNYSQITIGYNFEYGDLENTFSYPLTKAIQSISAVYNQKRYVTTESSLDDLRKDLVVTATFDNGTTEEIDYYKLSGSLSTIGTNTITVTFKNKSDTFDVNVTAFYDLKYYNHDGTQLLHTERVARGGNGTYDKTPTRASDSQHDYTFVGWSTSKNATSASANATTNITSNKSVYAAYSTSVVYYDLKYYNYDGSQLLNTDTVAYGGNGTYAGTPSRASDSQYSYTFDGWSNSMNATSADANATKNITADKNVYAAYTQTTRTYSLKYYNYDGTQLINTDTVAYGSDGTYTGTPSRASDSRYSYTFVGWSTGINASTATTNATKNITADKNVYAAYSKQLILHITYYNYDGSQSLYTEDVIFGEDATYDDVPIREPDSQYYYTFVGWSTSKNATSADANATKNITSNKSVYAAYSRQELGEDIPVDDQGETPLGGG